MTVCDVIELETGKAVTEETTIDSLGLDSLDFLDLMLAVEKESGKKVPDDKFGDLHTVGDIVRLAA
jgi:acyl carrier protein